ncbi:hypothetical protein G5I_12645 [Acromyrmex echinatior]|uniref:Uncharacterized protein n=1 Tax=Acromyrmex echinatior TaxID=103372 RepID=F4X2W3_ACREC|nr:hypothetical protein G5I_12645 [Acromyrmex echinatior]
MNDSRPQNPPFMSHSLRPTAKVTFLQEPTYETHHPPAPLAQFKQPRNNEVHQDQIVGVIQDQAVQRYYRSNTNPNYFVNLNYNGNKEARTSPGLSFHASVLTVLCTYLRRADVYISGGGDLIVAPHVCTKAGRSGKAWLTVLISDDRYEGRGAMQMSLTR